MSRSLVLGLGLARPDRGAGGQQPPPFAPGALAGLAFWYDAAESPITEEGGAVAEIQDLSGNGNHAGQGTAPARPTRDADVDGRPVFRFDGTDDVLTVDVPPDLSAGATLFAAFRIRSRTDFAGVFSCGAASGADHATFFTFQNAAASEEKLQLFARSGTAQPLVIKGVETGETQFVIIRIADDAALWRDVAGEQSATSTAATFGTPASVALGARLDDAIPFGFTAVDLYEIGLYPRQLDIAELDQLEAYLAARHGLAWTPKQFGSSLAWYHDAGDGELVVSGTSVNQWSDGSGNARHLLQVGDARPERALDDLGRTTVRFDGVDDALAMGGTPPALDPFTVAVVFTLREEADFSGILSAAPASGPDVTDFWSLRSGTVGSGEIALIGRDGETDTLGIARPATGATQIALWTVATGDATLRDGDGEATDSYDGGFGIPDEIVLGGRFDGSPYGNAAIDVYATVGVDRVLSAEEQTQLIAWAETRWGV